MTPTPLQYFTKDHAVSMTLRDYFAAKAMEGALSGCAARSEVVMYSEMASLAYEMADAMMAARSAT